MKKKSRYRYKKGKSVPARRFPWLWLVVGSALLLVAGGLGIVWASDRTDPNFTPEVTGSPRLSVEQTTIDEGDIKLDTTIRTTFRLKNVGDQPLHILGEPQVQLVEGCWPPRAVVGSTTLKPGQETQLTMEYMMHAGMDGQHQFDVRLRTNDPIEPEKVLIARSNWVP